METIPLLGPTSAVLYLGCSSTLRRCLTTWILGLHFRISLRIWCLGISKHPEFCEGLAKCSQLDILQATGSLKSFLWTTETSSYGQGLTDSCTCWVFWDLNLVLKKSTFFQARETTNFCKSMKILTEPQKMPPDAAELLSQILTLDLLKPCGTLRTTGLHWDLPA